MNMDEIAEIVSRIREEVFSQMDPLMNDLYSDALIHGMAVMRTKEDGSVERVDPAEWNAFGLEPEA